MEIREAVRADIDGILRIRMLASQNKLRFHLTHQMLDKALRRHCKAFVLINDNEEVVGFSLADKAGKLIWGLFVWEPFQGQGYGKLLLQVACEWLFNQRSGILFRKIKSIHLTTSPSEDALEFYQRLGWQTNGMDEHGDQVLCMTRTHFYQHFKPLSP